MTQPYELIAVGASWGGLHAVSKLLQGLREYEHSDLTLVIAQHRHTESGPELVRLLQGCTDLRVQDAGDKTAIEPGHVYMAPPDYHLLVEREGMLSLSIEERVNFARPSIDVLFESAADAYGERCIGVVLTGANEDGAAGLRRIMGLGGVAIVQDPDDAERPEMPAAAIAATNADVVLPLREIPSFIHGLVLETRDRSPIT
jgi:two-component system, chemotaxis family, protein-glutamate methylesterase/glutaminase